jgi:hypothetical protein
MPKNEQKKNPARVDYGRLSCIEGRTFPRGWPLNWPSELTTALDEVPDSRVRYSNLVAMEGKIVERSYPFRPNPDITQLLDEIDTQRGN